MLKSHKNSDKNIISPDKTADDIIRNIFSTDYIKVRASNISKQLGVLYEDRSKAQQLLSITTDKDQQKIIQSNNFKLIMPTNVLMQTIKHL